MDYSEQILGALNSGVIALDAEGIILTVNPAACQHLNIAEAHLAVGMKFDQIQGLAPLIGLLEELVSADKPIARREVLMSGQGGEVKEIGVSVSRIEGAEQYNGAIFLFVDITERRKLERAAAVNQQLASIGELAAGVVHELRNPLTIISGRAQLLERQLKDERAKGSVVEILNEVRVLERAIAQFLGFAKPFELRPIRCTCETVVERALQLSSNRAKAKEVHLSHELSDGLESLYIDKGRVSDALANIIVNAIDAVESGGDVHIAVKQQGDETEFQISDNGPGIHIASGEDLFSPFFTQKRDGTGLGLSLVKRAISAHGGQVTYENREEGGARFFVRLPSVQGRTA